MRDTRNYPGGAGRPRVLAGAARRLVAAAPVAAAAVLAAAVLIAGCGTLAPSAQGSTEFGPNQAAASAAPAAPATPAATPRTAPDQTTACRPRHYAAPAGPAALPDGYHSSAHPAADLCAALAAARKEHQEVLLDFGANWCVDCNFLLTMFRSPQVEPLLQRDYRIVPVDVGQWNLNLGFAARYVTLSTSGIPALVVLTSAGKVRVTTDDGKFEDAHTMDARQVTAFLSRWAAVRR